MIPSGLRKRPQFSDILREMSTTPLSLKYPDRSSKRMVDSFVYGQYDEENQLLAQEQQLNTVINQSRGTMILQAAMEAGIPQALLQASLRKFKRETKTYDQAFADTQTDADLSMLREITLKERERRLEEAKKVVIAKRMRREATGADEEEELVPEEEEGMMDEEEEAQRYLLEKARKGLSLANAKAAASSFVESFRNRMFSGPGHTLPQAEEPKEEGKKLKELIYIIPPISEAKTKEAYQELKQRELQVFKSISRMAYKDLMLIVDDYNSKVPDDRRIGKKTTEQKKLSGETIDDVKQRIIGELRKRFKDIKVMETKKGSGARSSKG